MKISKRILNNIITLIVYHGWSIAINCLILILLLRYFGKEGVGLLALFRVYTFLMGYVESIFIRPVFVKEMACSNSQKNEIFGTSIFFRILLACATIIIAWVTFYIIAIPLFSIPLGIVASVQIIVCTLAAGYETIYYVQLKMYYPKRLQGIAQISVVCFLCATMHFKWSLLTYYGGTTFISIIFLGILISHAHTVVRPVFISQKKKLWDYCLKAWPLFLSAVFIFIYHRIDQIMIYRFLGSQALGTYMPIVRIVESIQIIPVALAGSLLPLLSSLWQNNKGKFIEMYSRSFKYLTSIIGVLCVMGLLGATFIIKLFFGGYYPEAHQSFIFLLLSEVFVFVGIMNNTILIASERQRYDPIFTGVSAFMNVVLNLILIPCYGISGAAIATLCSYPIGPVLGYFFRETRPLSVCMWVNGYKPLIAAVVTYALGSALALPLTLTIVITSIAYFLMLYVLKGITKEDIALAKKSVRSITT